MAPSIPCRRAAVGPVVTDTRRVLGEICQRRLGSGRTVFGENVGRGLIRRLARGGFGDGAGPGEG